MRKNILTYLGIASILVGWGITWANQNAKIAENKANVELLTKRMDSVSKQTADSEKVIVRIETKVEYIMKTVDEIKAEIKKTPGP
ncbi:MAG: hypothetical protein FJ263_10790 [Planctomycetes bacterium]|nr:hypothetical protein [Planctomycetota bacterium]